MATFTGVVVKHESQYRFNNDDGILGQRLTLASREGDLLGQELNLKPYEGNRIEVEGEWEHEWIIGVTIIRISGQEAHLVEAKANRRTRLVDLLTKYNSANQSYSTDFDKDEFMSLMKEFGHSTAGDLYCSCDNGYACNPSSPPPNCGHCTCVDIP